MRGNDTEGEVEERPRSESIKYIGGWRGAIAWLRSAREEFPACVEQIAARGDHLERLVMIAQPLWLTPKRYERLSALRSPKGLKTALSAAIATWLWTITQAFPEMSALAAKAFVWDPVLKNGLATATIVAVFGALLCVFAGCAWLTLRVFAVLAGLRQAKPIHSPPFGYHLRLVSGHFAWAGVLIGGGTILGSPVVGWITHGLSTSGLGLVLVPLFALAAGATMILSVDTHRLRNIDIFDSHSRALRYQYVEILVLLTLFFGVASFT